jgi:hypothetical protein
MKTPSIIPSLKPTEMHKHLLILLFALLCRFTVSAQTDTMYFMKNGYIIHRQSIVATDLDSIVFYYPGPGTLIKLPTLRTGIVGGIGPYSAQCGGMVLNNNGAAVFRKGICWDTTATPSLIHRFQDDNSAGDSIKALLNGLKPATKYYYRAYAENKKGISYGQIYSFVTDTLYPPTLKITQTLNVAHNSAELVAAVLSNGGDPISQQGFCWSKYGIPTKDSNSVVFNTGDSLFTANLTKLLINSTYRCRAFASNNMGLSYSTVVTFTTLKSTDTAIIQRMDTLLSDVTFHASSYLYPTKISYPALKKIKGILYLYQTNNITEVLLPELVQTNSYVYLDRNLHLSAVYAPKLQSVANYIYISGNSALVRINFCNLKEINCNGQEPYMYINANNAALNTACFSGAKLNGTEVTLAPVVTFSANTAEIDAVVVRSCEQNANYRVLWSLSPNPMYGSASEKNCTTSQGKITATLTGLAPNTKYYLRVYKNSNIYSNEVSFTTAP